MAENSSFTFWANMKEAIEMNRDEHYKYLLYDAITEYGLYGVMPEDDGTELNDRLRSAVQALVPSLDKSRGYTQNQAELGAKGGRVEKITSEQIKEGVIAATKAAGKVPTRDQVVSAIEELFGIKVSSKTISRKCGDAEKKEIAESVLQGQNGDKIDVPQGQNEDKTYVPDVPKIGDKTNVPEGHEDKIGTKLNVPNVFEGQNGDKKDVPGDKTNVPFVFDF